LQHVFDPFFTTKEEGTGLGLPICRQIVEQHGGMITAEFPPDGGSRFVVVLPTAADDALLGERHAADSA
jgi:two-component system sensor histidine kinase AtoS